MVPRLKASCDVKAIKGGNEKESSFSSVASTSQEDPDNEVSGLASNRTLRVTLLSSEWKSSKGGLSTINRELAIQLAKQPNVEVSVYLPQCSQEDKTVARDHNVRLIEAESLPGYEPIDWLAFVPQNHAVDCIIGHGVHLGRQIPLIKRHHNHCKWIQVVHTAPEELGMFKCYADAISKGEKKHQTEVELCERADQVVAVGPKLADAYARYLRSCQKDQDVLNLTPSIFTEFSEVKQATEERNTFNVLVFGRGDSEDFELKGYDIAAQAVHELKEISYRLIFVGAPSGKEDEVAEKLVQCGISRSQLTVRCFNESREWLAKLFCEVDLAIMPSRTEGFGLTALEALSAGLPVLVSGNSGLGEALKKVPTGSTCVVDSEDPRDWAKEIMAVHRKDRNVRLAESKLLCEKYLEKYSWQEPCGVLVDKMHHLTFDSLERTASSTEQGKRPSSFIDTRPSERLREELSDHHEDCDCHLTVGLLRDEYSRRANLKPLIWEKDSNIHLPLRQVYTALEIKHRKKPYFRLTNQVVHMYDIFNSKDERDAGTGDSTNPTNESDDRNKMVLVEGSPGIGKTTFCIKMAHDWARKTIPKEHDFPSFHLILLLKCRDMDGDVMQAINDQLLPEDMKDNERKELMDYIRDVENQDKILLILDGLDELPTKAEEDVDKLLNRKVLPHCFILATSREERGIKVRQQYDFGITLQIKGFTEENSFEYVRRHFKIVDHEKGERLIEAFKKNALLDALRNNPLNLLLLCIVFEDYEGELPSSATELYQIIVHCILRRFCTKHNLEVPDDDKTLEKKFKESLLALGELAWRCLLKDRFSFREGELEKFESIKKALVARNLGLVFKEASVKKIKPQHEYHFFHNTFQEYLAASYLAIKLLREEVNVFDVFKLSFDDIPVKHRQVFLFVSGILGDQASVLFKQIGEKLKSKGSWDWLKCSKQEATFFADSFSESGNAEKMAIALCSFIPFPQVVEIVKSREHSPENFVKVFNVCKSCTQLPQPANLFMPDAAVLADHSLRRAVLDLLAPCSQRKTLSIYASERMTSKQASGLFEVLSADSTLYSFTFKMCSIPSDVAAIIGDGLAANKSLTTVKFQLLEEVGQAWAEALEKGLSGETPPASVVLEICGSMSAAAMQALKKVLRSKHLASLVLVLYGDVPDSVVAAVGEGVAADTMLKTLSLILYGKLSCPGAICLERCFLKNRSLNELEVKAYGQLPDNWATVVKNVLSAKRPGRSCTFHPNPCIEVSDTNVARFCPALVENDLFSDHSLTLHLWGELSGNGAAALVKHLNHSSPSHITLNIHGNVTRDGATCLARKLELHKTLSYLTINIWGELARDGHTALQEIPHGNQKLSFFLNVNGSISNDWMCEELDFFTAAPLQFSSLFTKVMEQRISKLILTIKYQSDMKRDWSHGLGDDLAKSAITMFALTINNCSGKGEDCARTLSNASGKNISSPTAVSKVNKCSDSVEDYWGQSLGDGLVRSVSLVSLSLTINNHGCISGDWSHCLGEGLARNTSLITVILAINNYSDMSGGFGNGLCDGLAKNTSINTLSLTINNYSDMSGGLRDYLGYGLAENMSLTTLRLSINDKNGNWTSELTRGLARNTSLTTLSLTANNYFDWALFLCGSLIQNRSLTTLCLTICNQYDTGGDWARPLAESLLQCTSVTTFNLTINNYNGMSVSDGWFYCLYDHIEDNCLLSEFNLAINNYNEMSGGWASCLGRLASFITASFSLTVNNYCSSMSGDWGQDLVESLAVRPASLTDLSFTFTNYCEVSKCWLDDLCDILVKCDSFNTLKVAVNDYSVNSGGLEYTWQKASHLVSLA